MVIRPHDKDKITQNTVLTQSVDNSNSNGYNNTVLAITLLGTAQNEFFIHEENQTSLAHTLGGVCGNQQLPVVR